MSEQNSAPPSEEDVRAAELVLQQHREALATARREALGPLLAILQGDAFASAVASIEALNDRVISPHFRALQAGAEQLVKIGAQVPGQ